MAVLRRDIIFKQDSPLFCPLCSPRASLTHISIRQVIYATTKNTSIAVAMSKSDLSVSCRKTRETILHDVMSQGGSPTLKGSPWSSEWGCDASPPPQPVDRLMFFHSPQELGDGS